MPPVHKTSAEAIVAVASQLAEAEGLRGVGVRAIAARLKVSPGTLYNVIGDIDDIIQRVNERTLLGLRDALLAAVDAAADPVPNLLAMAEAYVDFVTDNPRRWSMVLEHTLGSGRALPEWYRQAINRTVAAVDVLLQPLIADRGERRRAVAVLWAALEGTASLTASGKLEIVDDSGPHALVKLLITRFVGSFVDPDTAHQTAAHQDVMRHDTTRPAAPPQRRPAPPRKRPAAAVVRGSRSA